MKKQTMLKAAIVAAALFAAGVANAATYTWTGGGDNATFTDMQNWGQAEGTAFDTAGSYTFPSTTTASAIAFPSGSTQVNGTITFDSGCPSITFSGGAITKVVKVVSNSSNNMTFNNAVTFNGNIDVTQVAAWNEDNKLSWTPPNGRVIFWGGATGTTWTRYNSSKNIVSGHYILTTTSAFGASTGNGDRTIIAPNSSLTVKYSDQIQELYLMPGAEFIVTTLASHGWGNNKNPESHRLWCWNNGGRFITTKYSMYGAGTQWLGGYRDNADSCQLNKNWKLFADTIETTSTGGICLHSYSNNTGTDYADIYVGSGGMKNTSSGYMRVENYSHPVTIHPINSDFTIARGTNGTGDLQLGNSSSSGATTLTLDTVDTNGVPRKITINGKLSSTTTTAVMNITGSGTNYINFLSNGFKGTYAVTNGATAVFAAGKGFSDNGVVSVASGSKLVAEGTSASYAKTLKVANGATLEFALNGASWASITSSTFSATSGSKATIRFTPGSVKKFGPSYTLIKGANLANASNFVLPEGDGGTLFADSGSLVYIAPKGDHDYIWTGEGDGVTFNNMANWGGNAGDAFDESGTYMFAAGAPANVEVVSPISAKAIYFAAGCPAVTIDGAEIVSVDSITCQNGQENEFQNAVSFSDMINVTATSGHARFSGGATGTLPTLHYEYYGIYKCTTSTTWQPAKATTIKSGSEFYIQNYCGGTGTVTIESGAYMCVTNAYAGNAQRIVNSNNGVFEALGNIVFNATSTADADRPKFSVNEVDEGMYIANGIVNNGKGIAYLNAYKSNDLTTSKRIVIGSGGISGSTAVYFGNGNWKYPFAAKADWEMTGAGFGQWNGGSTALLQMYTYSERFAGGGGHKIKISAPIPGNAKMFVYGGNGGYPYEGRTAGIVEFNATCAFTGGLDVKEKSSIAIRAGKQAGTGTITVRDASSLIFPDTGTVTLAGPLTLEANSTLEFKVAKAANAVLNRNSKTLTLPASGKVKVKLTADSLPAVGTSYTLTDGAGLTDADESKFELDGVGGSLSVSDGELVYTAPAYFYIKVAEEAATDLKMPMEWIVNNNVATTSDSIQTVKEALERKGANDIPAWQSYCLGLDPNKAESVVLCDAATEQPANGTVNITARNLNVPGDLSGVEVTAYLDRKNGSGWDKNVASATVVSGTATLASPEIGDGISFFE